MTSRNLREILYKNVLRGNLKEVELLLDHHPHLLSDYQNKLNLLNIAIQNNDVKLMNLLVNYNINPNVKYKGLSSLHLAIQRGTDIQIIKSLISLSVNLDEPDKYGNTPLHFAAKFSNTEIIRELISAGANVNYMNNAYLTPLEIAQKNKRLKAACLLIRAGTKRRKSFVETLKLAYSTANIYRKATILVVTIALLTINTIASVLTYGLLFPTIIISILASIGVSIVCLAKPFFRIKLLERKIMNKQINQDELQELFLYPLYSESKHNIPATDLVAEAINDNFFLMQHKSFLEKTSSDQAQIEIIKGCAKN